MSSNSPCTGLALSFKNPASERNVALVRLGIPELVVILIVALLVWAPVAANRQRFNALTATFNETFSKTFFITLTIIFALFSLAELWLLGSRH
jgi:hypothetical protein